MMNERESFSLDHGAESPQPALLLGRQALLSAVGDHYAEQVTSNGVPNFRVSELLSFSGAKPEHPTGPTIPW